MVCEMETLTDLVVNIKSIVSINTKYSWIDECIQLRTNCKDLVSNHPLVDMWVRYH